MEKSIAWTLEHFDESDEEEVIQFAQELIRSEPYNPPGDERRAAAFAARILEEAGFSVTLDEFEENRCNVTAVYGNKSDIRFILNGHLDVVPAFGKWLRPPSKAQREDGILYGRGSCDMLGGCAAILKAATQIGKVGLQGKHGVMVILVSDEEDMNRGIRHILSQGKLKAECALIAEPTGCEVHLGNRGFSSYYVTTRGVGCHASEPWNGENAIYKMGRVIQRIEDYAEGLTNVRNEYLGQATSCIGTIKGGVRLNTVPDECVIEVERRLLPGEDQHQIHKELQAVVGELGEVKDRSFFPASLIDKEHMLVANCCKSLRSFRDDEPMISVFRACTEASMFSVSCQIPTLLLGPGSIDQAHRENEFCPEEEIITCAKVFTALMYYYLMQR